MVDTAVEVDDVDLGLTSRGGTASIAASVASVTEIRRLSGRLHGEEISSVMTDEKFEQAISDVEGEEGEATTGVQVCTSLAISTHD